MPSSQRKSRTAATVPPPPPRRSVPPPPPSPSPNSIKPVVHVDTRSFPPPPRSSSGRDNPKNFSRRTNTSPDGVSELDCISESQVLEDNEVKVVNKPLGRKPSSRHGAESSVGESIYSANFMEYLSKADIAIEDAEKFHAMLKHLLMNSSGASRLESSSSVNSDNADDSDRENMRDMLKMAKRLEMNSNISVGDVDDSDRDNMRDMLKMAKRLELNSNITVASAAESQNLDSSIQESLDRQLEGLTYFSRGIYEGPSVMSSRENPTQQLDPIKMLYGEDSLNLLETESTVSQDAIKLLYGEDTMIGREVHPSSSDTPVSPRGRTRGTGRVLSDRQLTALFAMDPDCLRDSMENCCEEESPPDEVVLVPKDEKLCRARSKSRDSHGSMSIGRIRRDSRELARERSKSREPRGSKDLSEQARTMSKSRESRGNVSPLAQIRRHSNSNASSGSLCGQIVATKTTDMSSSRGRFARSNSCGAVPEDSPQVYDFTPQHPSHKGSSRRKKSSSNQYKRSSSEGLVLGDKIAPPPLLQAEKIHHRPSKKDTPKKFSASTGQIDNDVHCLSESFADMIAPPPRHRPPTKDRPAKFSRSTSQIDNDVTSVPESFADMIVPQLIGESDYDISCLSDSFYDAIAPPPRQQEIYSGNADLITSDTQQSDSFPDAIDTKHSPPPPRPARPERKRSGSTDLVHNGEVHCLPDSFADLINTSQGMSSKKQPDTPKKGKAGRKKVSSDSLPAPPLKSQPRKRCGSSGEVHCISNSFADVIAKSQLSSNRSLEELECSRKNDGKTDEGNVGDVHCISDSYAGMIATAQRLSSNRSLGEPSILGGTTDDQYWKDVRGRPKSKKLMKGRGRSSKSKTDSSNYESCGELSGAELSVAELSGAELSGHSRHRTKSKNSRWLASQRRKMEHERKKQERMHERSSEELNRSCLSVGHSQKSGAQKQKKKSGFAAFFRKKDPKLGTAMTENVDIGLSFLSGTDTMSLKSSSSRKSVRSAATGKSNVTGRSKKSAKSLFSFKKKGKNKTLKNDPTRRSSIMGLGSVSMIRTFEKEERMEHRRSNLDRSITGSVRSSASMASGATPILSAAADIFQHQCIPVDIKPVSFCDESSCSSSLSGNSDDDDFDFDDDDSEDSGALPMLASVAEAVEHFNSQNKLEKFVSKVKHFV